MNSTEIRAAIEDAVEVTPALVLQAKAHIVASAPGRTTTLMTSFAAAMRATVTGPVLIHHSIDPAGIIESVSRWLACHVAAGEAVWALVGAGALVPRSAGSDAPRLDLAWTTLIPGSGGESSDWNFEQFAIPVPTEVALPSSGATHLTDGDLYLRSLDTTDLDASITESLRTAVACFRFDLYLPSQVMLARAAEGAWTLLGEALVNAAPTESAAKAVGRDLERGLHFKNLAERVAVLYTHAAYAPVVTASGVRPADLRDTQVWTEALREARNAVHHDADAPLPATWETTAALLMGAVPNLRRLLAVTSAARAVASQPA